jgi:MFS transporter, SP family, solute carrier family 2 (myo-inositol transporter), member 13
MMEKLTPTGTFSLYAAVCVLGWLAIWKIYPELGGLSLEHVGELLRSGWNVDESVRLARERRVEADRRRRENDRV